MSQTQELSASDSLERDDSSQNDDKKKQKSRRPPNTAFRQQRLKAWQPILTPKTVLPLFFAVGIIFAPLGGLMLYASSQVQEVILDYTDCATRAPEAPQQSPLPDGRVTSYFLNGGNVEAKWSRRTALAPYANPDANYNPDTTVCQLQFDIPEGNSLNAPVLLYYRLTKFYQNHRRYVKSLSQDQLNGDALSNSTIDGSDCDPLTLDPDGFAYYPCGLIANSIFNDTIESPVLLNARGGSDASNKTYNMVDKGIAWSSDAELYGPTQYRPDQVVPPPNWRKKYPHGYNDDFPLPNLHKDEAFQVWMRTAGLPTFSKLARRNDDDAMHSGTYLIDIYDEFPVSLYGGTKSILISTRTVMGGKNPFLGIAYVVVGGVCVLMGAIFTATHLIKPRKLGDHTYLTWNNERSTATSTGRSLRPNDA